jgi:regulator of sirC expression with transglutaminase-like and TPR domain
MVAGLAKFRQAKARRSAAPFALAHQHPHVARMDDYSTQLGLIEDEDIVLDEAALSLALLDHEGTQLPEYHRLLDAVATRLDMVGRDAHSARQQADALSQVFYDEFGFVGDQDSYDDPANADLIRVLDRRRGLPVSLSILYVAAARRMGWAAEVLDVPGHVLVLIGDEAVPTIVDPFRGGSLVSDRQLAALVAAHTADMPPAVRHVAAMPNRAILVRLLLNQATRAKQAGKGRRALDLYNRMTMIAPSHGPAWWERARLELDDGDTAAARHSLTAMLEVTREPEMRLKITETLDALVEI